MMRAASGAMLVGLAALLARPADGGSPAPAPPRYTDRDLWLGPATVEGGPIYFPDEMVPIADAAAELLARPEIGYRVIPPKDLRPLWREAQAGRLPGRSVPCGVAPPPSRLARQVYRGASMADLEVVCPDGSQAWGNRKSCLLDLRVLSERPTADNPDHLEETAHFHADLPAGETPARWAERLRAGSLARGEPKELANRPGILGLLGDGKRHKEPPFRIEVSFVSQSSGWKGTITSATFDKQGAALDACTKNQPRWRDNWAQPYLLEVDAAGAVKRCELAHVDHLAPPEFGCVCDVLRKRGFEAGPPGRRASLLLEIKHPVPHSPGSAALVGTRATDPSATLGDSALDEEALGACLSPVRAEVNEPELPVRFTIGPDGAVISHAATWPRAIPARVRRCLDDVLDRSRFDCPFSGASTVDAKLQVFVTH
jgi:hypothetical protein